MTAMATVAVVLFRGRTDAYSAGMLTGLVSLLGLVVLASQVTARRLLTGDESARAASLFRVVVGASLVIGVGLGLLV
jgi:hypothetical protein